VVNFTNILQAAFAPNSFQQKISNPNLKSITAVQKNLSTKTAHEMFMKLTPIFTNILQAAFAPIRFPKNL
jgi:hypothetical protein